MLTNKRVVHQPSNHHYTLLKSSFILAITMCVYLYIYGYLYMYV